MSWQQTVSVTTLPLICFPLRSNVHNAPASYSRDRLIEKGAKATMIQFAKKTDTVKMVDGSGKDRKDDIGKVITQAVKLEKPILARRLCL